MGLFSGMQIFNILCSIIKTKLVAMWLQAEGVGLFGMYNTTIETISTFTNMGLRQSSVRDISINKNDSSRLAFIVAVVRRWSLVAGLLGAIVISALAPILAESIFGDWTHCWGFVALSASMMLNAMLMGEQSILPGTGRLKALAKGSFWGTLTGLVASVPMFYYMGEDSVVWSIIVYSV
ncbi:MAG: oligosaccharide flippase family protein, partial [Muribaculaceae bacterium]|nr:oligosaccharide flippase family protein [Muribaculaceae bacterium]